MKLRFTTRDLLWLMLVVAVAFGVSSWWSLGRAGIDYAPEVKTSK